MKKPIVGVMPLWDDKKDSIWMLPGYMDGLSQAGAIPMILPFSEDAQDLKQLAESCDGFLFTGGHDVSPCLYDETPIKDLVSSCEKRDTLMYELLPSHLWIHYESKVFSLLSNRF